MSVYSSPRFGKDQEVAKSIEVYISGEDIATFVKILDRALNCWPNCPPQWKSLADNLKHGKELQPYFAMEETNKLSTDSAQVAATKRILTDANGMFKAIEEKYQEKKALIESTPRIPPLPGTGGI